MYMCMYICTLHIHVSVCIYVIYSCLCVCAPFVEGSSDVNKEWLLKVEMFGYEEFADLRYAFLY